MKEGMKMDLTKRYWIATASQDRCRHADALQEIGFINWVMGDKFHFKIGDVVYLFMKDERRVRFQLEVIDENCKREDQKYWIETAPNDITYKLKFLNEYDGCLLDEVVLREHGFKGGTQNPTYKNTKLTEYITSVFEGDNIVLPDLSERPILYVDLNSGSYVLSKTGHEKFNLDRNPVDGRFYGYCPAHGNVEINSLGAKPSDNFISGVIVVYTTKINNSSDRKVIAFCENATVHRKAIIKKRLRRNIPEENAICSYAIESDELVNLSTIENPFVIHIADYNVYMFRQQRFYKGTYPALDEKIVTYIRSYLNNVETKDDLIYQEEIQATDFNIKETSIDTSNDKPEYLNGNDCRTVKKNAKIAKQALHHADYKCIVNHEHYTFKTAKAKPYMEGHHLIPCTYSNALHFWKTRRKNIDCENNIVCLCPTCHRQIHYGSDEEKRTLIEKLYSIQKGKLAEVGLDISLDELLEYYIK